MSQGNARIGRHPGCRRDRRHHLEGDAFVCQGVDLFAAAAEDERIAALEAADPLALFGEAHQELIDAFLGDGVVVALLAHIDAFGVPAA